MDITRGDDGNTGKEIEQVPVADGTYASHLRLIGLQLIYRQQMFMGIQLIERTVAKGDNLV